MTPDVFNSKRQFAETPFGRIAYVESGKGPAALLVHGFPLNGYHWRGVLERLGDIRRCIAVDLMGLGHTETQPGQKLDFATQADMLASFLEALGVSDADIVGNDSGTAIVQLLAVRHPEKVRSLCLTNGDAHDNYPPPNFTAMHDLAKAGKLADLSRAILSDQAVARDAFQMACERPEELTHDILTAYLAPAISTPQRAEDMSRYITAMDNRQMTAVEQALRRLDKPVLVAWGDDDAYFPLSWGEWLATTLPGARLEVVPGGRLFFPEERPEAFSTLLRQLWTL